jgi:hypothetical protein
MIQNEQELQTNQERIAYFLGLLSQLRATARPVGYSRPPLRARPEAPMFGSSVMRGRLFSLRPAPPTAPTRPAAAR